MNTEDAEAWRKATEDEFLAQIRNVLWEIVEHPASRRVIGSRFVFRTKGDVNDIKKKVRLVAKGCSQRPGDDFYETFSPVARSTSIRVLAALAAEIDLEIHQADVFTAYLHSDLGEDVYTQIPNYLVNVLQKIVSDESVGSSTSTIRDANIQGTAARWLQTINTSKNPVCVLKKALYGLKQSGLRWYQRLGKELNNLGLESSIHDPCLYVAQRDTDIMIVAVYVDDVLIASGNLEWIQKIKLAPAKAFEMKDLGVAKRCLGIEFQRDIKTQAVFLSQPSYTNQILTRFNMSECKPVQTPIESECNLKRPVKADESAMAKYPYQQLIGALMYVAVTTRPDIAYVVNFMSQFNSNYNEEHWNAAKRIMR